MRGPDRQFLYVPCETGRSIIGRGTPQYGAIGYRPGENMTLFADITKAKTLLNWAPRIPLEVGLMRTIEWIKARQ